MAFKSFGTIWEETYGLSKQDEKPTCFISDGNVFAVYAVVKKALIKAGKQEIASSLWGKMLKCDSYLEVLDMFSEYVNIESCDGDCDNCSEPHE